MNLPNKLTLLRVIMIPIFLVVLLCPLGLDRQVARYLATAIFCIASATDALDGHIARKYNLVTNFGKFMDPLADKLLVSSAMIALIGAADAHAVLPNWVVIIIIAREFVITGFRTLAVEQNIVIAASKWGKAKTISQMIMLIVLLLNFDNIYFTYAGEVLIVVSVLLTIISAVDYIIKNKGVLKG
jgi:CDP-diacylglycerol--glycerol-3-phosphate 3-phosphatidyltransferase